MATAIFKEEYSNLLEENDRYKQLISQQKDHLFSWDKEISVAESRIQEKLRVPGGFFKHRGKHRHRKHIRILENKLNQDTIKFNELLCRNADYRKDLDHLQQQKVRGCNIEKKFNRHLAIQQHIMEKLEESVSLAFTQRSEAETRMLEVRESIGVEMSQFTKRRMQLKILIHQFSKQRTFMDRKLQEIISSEEDRDSKKRKKQLQYQNEVKMLEMYMQGHNTLIEVTGERDLSQSNHMFIQNEQRNFAHINYINELHNRRNTLKSCIDKMKSDILFLEQESKGDDEQNMSQLKELQSELEKYSCLADSLEKQCTVVQKSLDQLKTAITSLFAEIMQISVIVTSDNIAHFTSILEESVSDRLIQITNTGDEQMETPPQKLLLANTDLLPEVEAAVETECGKSPSRSLKSA